MLRIKIGMSNNIVKVMEPRERVRNLLERKPVDRAVFYESLWTETNTRLTLILTRSFIFATAAWNWHLINDRRALI